MITKTVQHLPVDEKWGVNVSTGSRTLRPWVGKSSPLSRGPFPIVVPWTHSPHFFVYGEMLHGFCYHFRSTLAWFLITLPKFRKIFALFWFFPVDLHGFCLQLTI